MWMSWFAVGVAVVETVVTEAPQHHQRMMISSKRLRPVVNVGIVDDDGVLLQLLCGRVHRCAVGEHRF